MQKDFYYEVDGVNYLVNVIYKKCRNVHYRFKDNCFVVTCPRLTSKSFIENGLNKFGRKLVSINPKFNGQGDDYIYILGEKVNISFPGEIKFTDGTIIKFKDKNSLDKKIKSWFKNLLVLRVRYYEKLMNQNDQYNVMVRKSTSRFGSNSKYSKTLSFSTMLIHYSLEIIDSVIVHEIAHCFVFNHSKDFYDVVYKYCPNYDSLRVKLRKAIFK